MTLLSVNVDHVATLRQARGVEYPDPVEAARIAEDAGAIGITVHLRSDRRHIQDADVEKLRGAVRGKLNLEMAVAEEMLGIALDLQPEQVTLVPERPEEVTTEGGLNLVAHGEAVSRAAAALSAGGIDVSVFIDPDLTQIKALSENAKGRIRGFEINTDSYTRSQGEKQQRELSKIQEVAAAGAQHDLGVYAGHGLTVDNVPPVSRIPEISELNIGHAIISRAVIVGMERAVSEMLRAMASS